MTWPKLKISKEIREAILKLYLQNPKAGTAMAMAHGLSPAYAYRLANERGLVPRRYDPNDKV